MSEINLPEGWIQCELADISEIITGKTPSTKDQGNFGGGIPFIKPGDLNQGGYISQTVDTLTEQGIKYVTALPKNSIAVTCIGNLGKVGITTKISASNQQINSVVTDKNIFYKYVYYSILTLGNWLEGEASATTVAIINKGKFSKAPLLLPPLAEQQQIAQKLDELLAQVDTLKTRLDAIPNILKRFRQSVLAAAVSGRLTQEWRSINETPIKNNLLKEISEYWAESYKIKNKKFKPPVIPALENPSEELPESWINTQIGYIFDVHVGATPSRAEESYWGGEINWVSSSEVAFCRIKSTKEKITDEGLKSASTTVHPKGTVMLAMIGQGKTRGQVGILDIEACHNQNTAALRVPEDYASSVYLYFYLTKQYEETRRVGSGNNQQALNKATVQGLPFPLPPLEEQTEIVRRVEQLFVYADQIEQRVQDAQASVNHLTQSILAKAFRGELTADWRAQNPELISGENSAAALLERIKAEREVAVKSKRKVKQ